MSKDSGTGGGLLSKVVKFVTSPTTHWSDLDRPEPDASDIESRLALKEMIERKRRNDFVRNREFDMLRKLRRRERAGEVGAQPSFYPSSLPANTGERARTLKKIDEIEQQMSNAWFHQKEAQAPAVPDGPVASPVAPSIATGSDRGVEPAPVLTPVSAAVPPPPAFAPTIPMRAVPLEPEAPPPREAPRPSAPASAPVPMHEPAKVATVYGDVAEINVEVVLEAKLAPELEEAAIRFANGDTDGAEAALLDLLGEQGARHDDVDTWLMLFDLYRASGQQDKFDDAAVGFAARFGRSAPQWATLTERAVVSMPAALSTAAAPVMSGRFHWASPSVIGVQSVAALTATLARNAPPWRIDWHHLKSIDPAALPAFLELLRRWGDTQARFRFLGADRLLEVLAAASPTDDRSVDPRWWEARLALLRVMGEMDDFELVALNYCVTYEVSPPAWEAPQNTYAPISDDGHTVPPSSFGPDALAAAGRGAAEAAAPKPDEVGVLRWNLDGELLGSAEALTNTLDGATARVYELNCRKLLRVDFGAAGDLLNWTLAQKSQGHAVTFKQVNRLIAAFFGVIGINESARIMLRPD